MRIIPKFKIWFEDEEGQYVFGKGSAELLEQILKYGDLGKASKNMHISYRKAWNILKNIEKNTGVNPVITHRGGKGGGGGIELSEFGRMLVEKYREAWNKINECMKNMEPIEAEKWGVRRGNGGGRGSVFGCITGAKVGKEREGRSGDRKNNPK